MTYSVPAYSEYTGERMVISFRGYYDTPADVQEGEGFEWDTSGVLLDKVKITREKNSGSK